MYLCAMNISDLVLLKNNQFIVLNKPPAIPTTADKTGDKSLFDLAEIYCQCTLYPVHRLDRPASGLVVFAKTPKAATELSAQFRERSIEKTYLAVVKNEPLLSNEATLVHHIQENKKTNLATAHAEPNKQTQIAELSYKVKGAIENYQLLEIQLLTGRHHQIRAQLTAIGFPIKGDVKYGARRGNTNRSINLHAWKLKFLHPVSKETIELEAALPEDSVWKAFGI